MCVSPCTVPVMLTVSATRETKPRDVTCQGSRALINFVGGKKKEKKKVIFGVYCL